MSDSSNGLPQGPPIGRRALPSVPLRNAASRPVSMPPPSSTPCPPPRTESVAFHSRDKTTKRPRPVITVVDARPMSEVGFRSGDMKSEPKPSRPDVTIVDAKPMGKELEMGEKSVLRRPPPPPARPPSQRQSMNVQENNNIDDKPLPDPPKATSKPPRPLSMLAKFPMPRRANKPLVNDPDGIENEGFEERNNRLNSLERDVKTESLIDFDTEVSHNKSNEPVPDLISDGADQRNESQQNFDLLSDVQNGNRDIPNDNAGESINREETVASKPRGIPVFPPGVVRAALPTNRGPPPPLPKKSPSVSNISSMSGDVTWNKLGFVNNGRNDEKAAEKPPSAVRKPTIIRPGKPTTNPERISPSIPAKDEADGIDKKSDSTSELTSSHHSEHNVVLGGVKVFPFAVPRSRSENESLSHHLDPPKSDPSQSHISKSKPPPMIKPKPMLMPKPSLRPKPNLAPKPVKRPQSEMIHSLSSLKNEETKEDHPSHTAKTIGLVKKEPWQNELNALLESKRKPPVARAETATPIPYEVEPDKPDEWDEPPQPTVKKPGPLKATYRPTIIRAVTKPKEAQHLQEEKARSDAPSVISKRFSTSCIDMRSAGESGAGENVETNNNFKTKDDIEYKPKQPSPQPRKRSFGPTIIRPKSISNLTIPTADNDNFIQNDENDMLEQHNVTGSPKERNVRFASDVKSGDDVPLRKQSTEMGRTRARSVSCMPDVLPSKKSGGPPTRPRAPSPLAFGRRRSSTGSSDDIELAKSTSPVMRQKKSPPGKPPPPRPASGPRRESLRRRSDTPPKPAPPSPTHKKSSPGPTSPAGPHGVAMHDYPAQHSDELTFSGGDVIELVREVDADWFVGRCNNNEGMFPKNFVNVVIPLSDSQQPEQSHEQQQAPSVITTPPTPAVNRWEDSQKSPVAQSPDQSGPHCIAIHDYISAESGDLSFTKGAVIKLLEKAGDEWRRGDLYGTVGIFPVTFVEIVQDCVDGTPEEKANSLQVPEQQQHHPVTDQADTHATALYEFSGQEDELTFKEGDIIQVLATVNEEWLYGETHGQKGNFPASFIAQVPANLPVHIGENQEHPSEGFHDNVDHTSATTWDDHPPRNSEPAATLQQPSPPAQELTPALHTATILYDFPGQNDDDLPLTAGCTVEITEIIDRDWMKGRIGNVEGMFPANFVEIIS